MAHHTNNCVIIIIIIIYWTMDNALGSSKQENYNRPKWTKPSLTDAVWGHFTAL